MDTNSVLSAADCEDLETFIFYLFPHSVIHAYDIPSSRFDRAISFASLLSYKFPHRSRHRSSKLARSTRALLERMVILESSRIESPPREISLAGLSSSRDLEREPRTPVIVIARPRSLACSRSSGGRTSRAGGCRRKLAGIEKQRRGRKERERRTNEKKKKKKKQRENR